MSSQAPSCIIVDDHPITRDGVRSRIERLGYQVVAEAASATEALELLRTRAPAFAMIDYVLGDQDGIELARRARAEGVPSRLILFTADTKPATIERALEAGLDAYLGKSSTTEVLNSAIEAVLAGKTYIDPTLLVDLMTSQANALTPKEMEVLRLLGEGLPNKVIAARLDVSIETTKSHVTSLMRKLEATSRTEAVVQGFRQSLLS